MNPVQTWFIVIGGTALCIGAGAAILIAAKVEGRHIERPSAGEAATDVGADQ